MHPALRAAKGRWRPGSYSPERTPFTLEVFAQPGLKALPRLAVRAIAKRATILSMHLFQILMAVLETMFFVGLAGSSIVVIISFIEDGKELFGKD